jgi:tetratricopeptide (TPR) repeat protein
MTEESNRASGRQGRILGAVLVGFAVAIASCNSFSGPFIFDDIDALSRNPEIRGFVPLWHSLAPKNTLTGRPVLRLTFAVDYWFGGERVFVYHLTNFVIHLSAALVLYGIVWRTPGSGRFLVDRKSPLTPALSPSSVSFRRMGVRGEVLPLGSAAPWLAAIAAAAWAVHPLNTEAVTYLVQRAESLAGLFYLLVIYCLIRQAEKSDGWNRWATAGAIFCGLGMGTKEVVATAPIMALLYDRTFLAGSFREALRRRGITYLALAATWGIVIWSVAAGARGASVGYSQSLTALDYARTQLGVIAHYLRLAIWPTPLILDYYGWPIAKNWSEVSLWGWCVVLLGLGTVLALWKKQRLGFLGAWVFIILAPTSSFVPIITEIAAEHRMYLPLAGIVTVAIAVGWRFADWLHLPRPVQAVLALGLLTVLATLTLRRNELYASPEAMWSEVIANRPQNPRAHVNLGFAYTQDAELHFPAGSSERIELEKKAVDEYRRALLLESDAIRVVPMLGEALIESGQLNEGEKLYSDAIAKYPRLDRISYQQRGKLRGRRGDWAEAAEDFRAAINLAPNDPEPHFLLALAYVQLHDGSAAHEEFETVDRISPGYSTARGLHPGPE